MKDTQLRTVENKNEITEERLSMLEEIFSSKEYKPMRFKDLVGLLQVPKSDKNELKLLLDQLMSKGSIMLDNQGRTGLRENTSRSEPFPEHKGALVSSSLKERNRMCSSQVMLQREHCMGTRL
jgi:hypothetical protein